MRHVESRIRSVLFGTAALGILVVAGFVTRPLAAAETTQRNKSGSGTFVSFLDGTLTLKGKSGQLVYDQVGKNYKTFQNNEEGPGSRLVGTVPALSGEKLPGSIGSLNRVLPGTMIQVNVEEREISFGFDYRIVGKLVSYQDGKLNLVAEEAPQGFVQRPVGNVSVKIDPGIPALESINGGDLRFAGTAGETLKAVKPGTIITVRSHYDVDVFEVVEVGEPKRRMERYIGQTTGPVQGTFVSFKDGILRINGKAIGSFAANEYDRLIARRITDDIPILESIDGGAYRPATLDTLKTAREGTVITIRKVEDIVLDIRVGVPK